MFFAPKMSLLKKEKLIGFFSQESFYFFKDRLSKVIKCLKGYTSQEDRAAIFMSETSSSPVSKDDFNFVIEKETVPSNRKEKRKKLPEGYQTQQKHRPACNLFVYQNIGHREKFLFLGRSFFNQDNKWSNGALVTSATSKKKKTKKKTAVDKLIYNFVIQNSKSSHVPVCMFHDNEINCDLPCKHSVSAVQMRPKDTKFRKITKGKNFANRFSTTLLMVLE